jgi:glutathione S-transferase
MDDDTGLRAHSALVDRLTWQACVYTLYIGNKNYSSWSLRPWVLMKAAGIPFAEERIVLDRPDSAAKILSKSPSGRVPCLHDDDKVIWDSLAIAEYLAERHPGLLPVDADARAWARCASAEMHSGFAALRNEFPMNVRLRDKRTPRPETAVDIDRIGALWAEGRECHGGGGAFLCGAFSIVDAFYCPVAFRFASYGVSIGPVQDAYVRTLLALPAMREWATGALAERESIAAYNAAAQSQQQ